jgi:signal transduction histidine kinase
MHAMKRVIKQLRSGELSQDAAADIMQELHERMAESRAFLSGPLSPDFGSHTRKASLEPKRWEPARIVASAKEHLAFFVDKRGAKVTFEADEYLLLPAASYAEWLTLLQNALVNAQGAIAQRQWDDALPFDQTEPGRIHIEFRRNEGAPPTILIHDNGTGIDLEKAPRLFKPFSRGTSQFERHGSGHRFGGHGLGLSIIQMLASRHGMTASFIEPAEGWATTLRIGPDAQRPDPKALDRGPVHYEDPKVEQLLAYGSAHSLQYFIEGAIRLCACR